MIKEKKVIMKGNEWDEWKDSVQGKGNEKCVWKRTLKIILRYSKKQWRW